MDPGDAGRILFVLGIIWSSPSSPPSSPSASPPPAAVDASASISPSTSSPPAAVDESAPKSPSTSSPPAAVDASAPISPSTSSTPAAAVAPLSSSSTSPLPDPPSSSSTSPPPATAPFRLGWCYLLGRFFNFTWRASGPPPPPSPGPTSAPSLAVTRNPIRRRCQTLGRRLKNVDHDEEAGESLTNKAIEVAEEREKVLQKERERKERERISEKRKQKKKRTLAARVRRSEERAKEEEAVRRAKDSDEARKAQLIDARRKAQEAQIIADERRKAELAAVKREIEVAAASKGKLAQGSRSAQRMPARQEAKNYARRATTPLQYRMYTDGISFKEVVLRTMTGKQQEDEMTQLAIAEDMTEPMSQSEEELKRSKRSEVAARRMAITDGKRPLLSPDGINAMPSEKPPSTTSTNQANQIYKANQQSTQEDEKKPREEVARAEEDELYRDVLFMLGAEEWNMWSSPDVGDTLRSIFCPLNGPSTLQKQLSYDSDNTSTESSSAQEEASSSETK